MCSGLVYLHKPHCIFLRETSQEWETEEKEKQGEALNNITDKVYSSDISFNVLECTVCCLSVCVCGWLEGPVLSYTILPVFFLVLSLIEAALRLRSPVAR